MITDTNDYSAFGEIFASTGTTDNAYLFTSQRFDDMTGQYYLRARYYDPGFGRFLSRDPVEVASFNPIELNRYVHAANNPPNLSDPSGLLALEYTSTFTPSVINLGVITTLERVALVSFALGYISLLLAGEVDAPDRVGPSPLPDYIEDRIGDIVTQAEAAEMARRLAELLESRPKPGPEPEESPGTDIFPPIPRDEPDYIYRQGRDQPRSVRLYRLSDWRTGLSFWSDSPPGESIRYAVNALVANNFVVRFDIPGKLVSTLPFFGCGTPLNLDRHGSRCRG